MSYLGFGSVTILWKKVFNSSAATAGGMWERHRLVMWLIVDHNSFGLCMCDVIVARCKNTWILNLTFFRTKITLESSSPSRLSRCDAKMLCCWLCQYHIILLGLVFSDSQRMETWQSAEMFQYVVKMSVDFRSTSYVCSLHF